MQFLALHLPENEKIDLLVSGENGDCRHQAHYLACEEIVGAAAGISRFKHMTGEFATAAAPALWLATHILQTKEQPAHMTKRAVETSSVKNILIYNNYRSEQHALMLVKAVTY